MATSPLNAADLNWLCRRIVEDTPDAIIFADADGVVRLWNAGAEAIFGYPAAEMLGEPLDRIIPEPLRARHNEGYRRVMVAGATQYARELLAVPGLRKDGTRVSLEFSLTLIRTAPDKFLGTAAIIRDVTAHWARDKALKQRLADLEAQLKHQTG